MRALSSLFFRFSKKQDFTECLKLLHDLESLILALRPFQIVARRQTDKQTVLTIVMFPKW